jgi:hypothetical protein
MTAGAVQPASLPFSDVPEWEWYAEAVRFVYERGYFVGTGAQLFSPDAAMTRTMFITVLGRLAKADISAYTTYSFADVVAGEWYAGYTEWAYRTGVAKGIGKTFFGLYTPVTREEMATMLYNYAGISGHDVTTATGAAMDYIDNENISDWARPAMEWMTANGIIQGKPGNFLDPAGPATRAEVAAIVMRFAAIAGSER